MSTNLHMNDNNLRKYRKELKAMCSGIAGMDSGILNKAVNEGLLKAKKDTPANAGYLRDKWTATKAEKKGSGVECRLYNTAANALNVNYGHRVKDGEGKTTGFATGKFILEKAIRTIKETLPLEFGKSVKEVKRKHAG